MKFLLASIAVFASLVTTLEAGQISELTDETFDNYLTVSKLAIVDFYAPWCLHCKNFAPIYNQAYTQAQAMKLDVFFAKVNCAESGKNICKKLKVRFLPTVRLFHDGKQLGDYNGKRTPDAVLDFLKKVTNSPNDVKLMMMSDGIGGKIPSNVTPWHADDKKKH